MPTRFVRSAFATRVLATGVVAGSSLLLAGAPAAAQQPPAALSDVASVTRHADAAASRAAVAEPAADTASAPHAEATAEPVETATAVAAQQPPSGPQRPMFQDIRYEEDWSVLGTNPSLKGDLWDKVKYIPIQGDSYWSIGGEIRHRFDYWRDANFGYVPARNLDSLLQRYMFHADLHVNKNVRAFGQFASALAGGRRGGPWPTDRNEAEVHQAFVEFMGGDPQAGRWSLRFGRQEMAFGQSHFISTSDFYNTRRTFDGVRAQAFKGPLEFNAFVVRPVQINVGKFNDDSDPNQIFFATSVFANNPFTRGRVSLFYIGLTTHQWGWSRGFGRDVRHTLGMRMMGMQGPWDYVYEVLIQRGKFADRIPISAWGVTTDTGYTIVKNRMYPRLGVRVNLTSGDRGVGKLGTFNPMFPDVAYSGRIGLIGPSNSIDVTPNLRLALTPRIYFIPDFALFWRQKTTDGIYGVVTPYVVLPGNLSEKRFIGGQLSLPMQVNLTSHLTYTVAFGQLFAGAFLKDLEPAGRSVTFLTNFLTYKF